MIRAILLAIGRAWLWLTTAAAAPTFSEYDEFDDEIGGSLWE